MGWPRVPAWGGVCIHLPWGMRCHGILRDARGGTQVPRVGLRLNQELGPAPAPRPQGHLCPPGTSRAVAGLGGVWCQQLQREIPFYPEPFPKLNICRQFPSPGKAVPELRGRTARASHARRKRVGVWGALGARKPPLEGGEGSAPRGERQSSCRGGGGGHGPGFFRGIFLSCPDFPYQGQGFSRGDKNQPKGSPSFPSAADPARIHFMMWIKS